MWSPSAWRTLVGSGPPKRAGAVGSVCTRFLSIYRGCPPKPSTARIRNELESLEEREFYAIVKRNGDRHGLYKRAMLELEEKYEGDLFDDYQMNVWHQVEGQIKALKWVLKKSPRRDDIRAEAGAALAKHDYLAVQLEGESDEEVQSFLKESAGCISPGDFAALDKLIADDKAQDEKDRLLGYVAALKWVLGDAEGIDVEW